MTTPLTMHTIVWDERGIFSVQVESRRSRRRRRSMRRWYRARRNAIVPGAFVTAMLHHLLAPSPYLQDSIRVALFREDER
jgi:hypothetical protein